MDGLRCDSCDLSSLHKPRNDSLYPTFSPALLSQMGATRGIMKSSNTMPCSSSILSLTRKVTPEQDEQRLRDRPMGRSSTRPSNSGACASSSTRGLLLPLGMPTPSPSSPATALGNLTGIASAKTNSVSESATSERSSSNSANIAAALENFRLAQLELSKQLEKASTVADLATVSNNGVNSNSEITVATSSPSYHGAQRSLNKASSGRVITNARSAEQKKIISSSANASSIPHSLNRRFHGTLCLNSNLVEEEEDDDRSSGGGAQSGLHVGFSNEFDSLHLQQALYESRLLAEQQNLKEQQNRVADLKPNSVVKGDTEVHSNISDANSFSSTKGSPNSGKFLSNDLSKCNHSPASVCSASASQVSDSSFSDKTFSSSTNSLSSKKQKHYISNSALSRAVSPANAPPPSKKSRKYSGDDINSIDFPQDASKQKSSVHAASAEVGANSKINNGITAPSFHRSNDLRELNTVNAALLAYQLRTNSAAATFEPSNAVQFSSLAAQKLLEQDYGIAAAALSNDVMKQSIPRNIDNLGGISYDPQLKLMLAETLASNANNMNMAARLSAASRLVPNHNLALLNYQKAAANALSLSQSLPVMANSAASASLLSCLVNAGEEGENRVACNAAAFLSTPPQISLCAPVSASSPRPPFNKRFKCSPTMTRSGSGAKGGYAMDSRAVISNNNEYLCDVCREVSFSTLAATAKHEATCLGLHHDRLRRRKGSNTSEINEEMKNIELPSSEQDRSVALVSSSQGYDMVPTNKHLLLATEDDTLWLSDLLCFVRSQIQVFTAMPSDVAARSRRGGIKQPIAVGRVGIRCIHCAHISPDDRAKGAVSYPNSIRIVHQSVRNWQRYHFMACQYIPHHVKDMFKNFKNTRSHSGNASLKYWVESCIALGMVDTDPESGIRYRDPQKKKVALPAMLPNATNGVINTHVKESRVPTIIQHAQNIKGIKKTADSIDSFHPVPAIKADDSVTEFISSNLCKNNDDLQQSIDAPKNALPEENGYKKVDSSTLSYCAGDEDGSREVDKNCPSSFKVKAESTNNYQSLSVSSGIKSISNSSKSDDVGTAALALSSLSVLTSPPKF